MHISSIKIKHALSCPCAGLGSRSASMSYLRILKHSRRSSKNSAYVLTQAEQSQAAEEKQICIIFAHRTFVLLLHALLIYLCLQ